MQIKLYDNVSILIEDAVIKTYCEAFPTANLSNTALCYISMLIDKKPDCDEDMEDALESAKALNFENVSKFVENYMMLEPVASMD